MELIVLSLGKVFILTGVVSLLLWCVGFTEGRKYERKQRRIK